MLKSIGTAVAGIMFIMGFVLANFTKVDSVKSHRPDLRPSIEMLKVN